MNRTNVYCKLLPAWHINFLFFPVLFTVIFLSGCKKDDLPQQSVKCQPSQLLDDWEIERYQLDIDINERDLDFPTVATGYVAGYDGKMIKTSDSGQSWNELYTGSLLNFKTVDFVNELTGFVAGAARAGSLDPESGKGAPFFRTNDGGQTWHKQYFQEYAEFVDLYFFDDTEGLAVVKLPSHSTVEWRIVKTTDSGQSWKEVSLSPSILQRIPQGFFFPTSSDVVLPGNDRNLYITHDRGATWDSISTPVDVRKGIRGFHPVTDQTFYLDGVTSIFKTENGGSTWTAANVPFSSFGFIHFYSSEEGFIIQSVSQYEGGDFPVFKGNRAYQTTDGGQSWTEVMVTQDCDVAGLKSFPQAGLGYSVRSEVYRLMRK